MPIRPRTIGLAVGYIDRHFGRRYLFPIKPGAKFPPLIKNNLADASNDPEQLRLWEEKWPGCSWGVSHAKSELLVADVDTNPKKGKVGQATYDDLDLMYGWPATERTTTPSGGFHMIYEGWATADHPAHIFALGENGIGKDIDSPNYTLIPGCTFDDGTSYVGNDVEAVRCPEWIYDTIKTAKTKSRITDAGEVVVELDQQANIDLAIDFLKNDAEPSIQGSGGDANLLKTAYYLKDIGISQQLGANLLNEYFNPRCEPPWDMADLEKKMAGAYSYANLSKVGGKTAEAEFADVEEDPPQPLTRLAQQQKKDREGARAREAARPPMTGVPVTRASLAVDWVWIGGIERAVYRADTDKQWKKSAFDNMYGNLKKKGEPKSITEVLLSAKKGGMMKFDDVVFKPGVAQTIGASFNLYTQPDIVAAEGDLTWWNEHLEYLFPDQEQRDHLLNWMAWLLQNPTLKPKHALILQGPQPGTGKSFVCWVLRRLIHEKNVASVSQTRLNGKFNSWAMKAKLVVIEELRAVERAEVKQNLHHLITEDVVDIERKGVDVQKAETCFGIFAMSNDDAAIMLDDTDRRYLIIRTDAKPKTAAYYTTLFQKIDDDAAMAAVLFSLVNRDLAARGYSGQQAAPMTTAKARMHAASLSDLESHILDNRETYPFAARVTSIDDIIVWLPKRLEGRGTRLSANIKSILEREFNGVDLGQCLTPSGARPRLWAIGPQAAFIAKQPRTVAGKLYEDDRKRAGQGQALSEFAGAAED